MASAAQEPERTTFPGGAGVSSKGLRCSGRVADPTRSERVGEIVTRLKAGDFDAARYESTPRLRAERLAQVLTRSLSRGALRRRLKRLGVGAEFCGGELLAISVEGGGLDVRGAKGQGQVLTGPGLNARLLAVFPELLPHTLTNLTVQLGDTGDVVLTIANPATSGSNALSLDLILFLKSYLASSAVIRYNAVGTGTGPFGSTFGQGTVTDPFSSGLTPGPLEAPQQLDLTWNAAGVNWIEIFATQVAVSPGNKSLSFSPSGFTTWSVGLDPQYVTVTYTIPPCATCTLNIQVHDACDGSGVGGAVLTLSNGLSCTTAGGGGCTISGIPDGSYTYTVTKTGYPTVTGSFTCTCGGGTSTLTVNLTPTGGCSNCDLTVTVIDYCTGLPLAGVDIYIDGVLACTTGASGVCVITGLANGDHTVVISRTGYATQTRTYRCTS